MVAKRGGFFSVLDCSKPRKVGGCGGLLNKARNANPTRMPEIGFLEGQ